MKLFLVKLILLFNILPLMSGCSQVSFGSKESIEAEEKKPWKEDQSTIAGGISKAKEKITPYIGIHVPIESAPLLSQTLRKTLKEPKKEEAGEGITTVIDKNKKTFRVINEDQRWEDISTSLSETSISKEIPSP